MVIIASVDRSNKGKRVVKEAETLARAFGEELHVIHVLSESESLEMIEEAAGKRDSSFNIQDEAAKIASNAAEEIEYPVKTIGMEGDPADSIVEYANEQEARYIVVGGRKRSPVGKAVFGSVAQSILLNSPCPVLSSIAPPHDE